jgi:hypothetical protein
VEPNSKNKVSVRMQQTESGAEKKATWRMNQCGPEPVKARKNDPVKGYC